MPSELSLRYAPWSISKLGQAENCPRQFELKHILKKTEEEAAARSETRVGVAAHAVLERRILGVDADVAVAMALEKTALTVNEKDMLSFLDEEIESFLRRLDAFCQRNGAVERFVERKWAIRYDGTSTGFFDNDVFFRGVVDLGILTKNKDLFVIDHKSGKAKDPKKYYWKQLHAYCVLGAANIPGIDGVRPGIHYLQGDEAQRIQWLDYKNIKDISDKMLPWLLEYVDGCAGNLASFEARPRQPWPCSWCGYRGGCEPFQEMTRAQEA